MPVPQAMGKWRQRLWPIYPDELKKFFPMIVIMFWVLFNYTVVRNIKDSLLVNAPYSSSKSLPWAKVCVVTPASILFVFIYAKLSNILSRESLYFSCLIPFTLFFIFFGFLIYPYHKFLNSSPETVLAWQSAWPGFKYFFPIVGYWTFTFFYAMAELWGNVSVAILFWQFANQITPTTEAKRFYPIFGFWSNLGLVAAGLLLKYVDPLLETLTVTLPTGEEDFSMQVKFFCSVVTFGSIIIGLAYWWMNNYVLTDPRYYSEASLVKKGKEPKPKLSIMESIKFLARSKYLWYITILVLSYGIAVNVVEVSWKNSVKEFYKGKTADYSAFMGNTFIYTGILTMLFILFSKNMIRRWGWKITANVTPWITLVSGALFFTFLIFQDATAGICAFVELTPLAVAVWLGLSQNVITKAAKYSLFDPTKEMTYIPLDEESKVKGKAAIDVIGGRAGKSGGSLVNMAFEKLSGNPFYLAVGSVMVLICVWWLWAVQKLSAAYQKKLEEKEDTGS